MRIGKTSALMALIITVIMCSCSSEQKDDAQDAQADALYEELKMTYKQYSDSLVMAADSAKIDSIAMRLDDRIKKIYLKYPADLDQKISEAQNDTLWQYASGIANLRNKMKVRKIATDSIPDDSVAITAPEVKEADAVKDEL